MRATLFGLECQRFGSGIVQVCLYDLVSARIGTPNTLADIELEVVVRMTPAEFSDQFAVSEIPVADSAEALRELGYELPVVIANKKILGDELRQAPTLSEQDIQAYVERFQIGDRS